MIYTVTFNPSLDYVVQADQLIPGEINRTTSEHIYPGGKGNNVSVILSNLGLESTAFGFTAGFTGKALQEMLLEFGAKTDFIPLADGQTRINVKINAGQETEINGQGPKITETAIQELFEKLKSLKAGDVLVLTKKLGVGIMNTANRVGAASKEAMAEAITSMTTLNKYAAAISKKYTVHACTDVTGFSFLGHLHEMLDKRFWAVVDTLSIPYIKEAYTHAENFMITAAGQRNRNHVGAFVDFKGVPFPLEEILFDPQTSGGLLFAVPQEDGNAFLQELKEAGLPAQIVGRLIQPEDAGFRKEITVL